MVTTAKSAIPADYETPNCFMTAGHDERFPVQTIRESDYELLIFWGSELEDPANDNLDKRRRGPPRIQRDLLDVVSVSEFADRFGYREDATVAAVDFATHLLVAVDLGDG